MIYFPGECLFITPSIQQDILCHAPILALVVNGWREHTPVVGDGGGGSGGRVCVCVHVTRSGTGGCALVSFTLHTYCALLLAGSAAHETIHVYDISVYSRHSNIGRFEALTFTRCITYTNHSFLEYITQEQLELNIWSTSIVHVVYIHMCMCLFNSIFGGPSLESHHLVD